MATDDMKPQGLKDDGRQTPAASKLNALVAAPSNAPVRFQRQGTAEAGNALGNASTIDGGAVVSLASIHAICKIPPSGGVCTIDLQGWGPGYAGSEDQSIFSSGLITIDDGETEWDPAEDVVVLDATRKDFSDDSALRAVIVDANGAEDVTLIVAFE